MTKVENWRPIAGTDGAYMVSDHGRVKSIARVQIRKDGTPNPIKERILVPIPRQIGHLYVALGKGRKEPIHRLVLEAFVGPRPKGMVTRHLDGNPQNNVPSNLAWGTQAENLADMALHGTKPLGERHGHAKLTNEQVCEIRRLKGSMYQREIAGRYGVTQTMVGRILRGKAWTHLLPTGPGA